MYKHYKHPPGRIRRILLAYCCLLLCASYATASRAGLARRAESTTTTTTAPSGTVPVSGSVSSGGGDAAARTTGTGARPTDSLVNASTDQTVPTAGADNAPAADAASPSSDDDTVHTQLPIEPRLTPALGVAGMVLLCTGAAYGLVGIRSPWLHTFLSSAFLTGAGTTVLIVHVMAVPVSDGIQGAYVVAVVLAGLVVGAAAVFVRDMTECLFAPLGGFCLSMWILTLAPGGLVPGTAARVGFIASLSLAPAALCFNRHTRDYGLIGLASFSGATAAALGADCFSRAGLKEFWLYIWDVNRDLFPPGTATFPITKGMRVETALVAVLCLIGVVSQVGLWRAGNKKARAGAAVGHRGSGDGTESDDAAVGRRVEEGVSHGRMEWEKTHGPGGGRDEGGRLGRRHSSGVKSIGGVVARDEPAGKPPGKPPGTDDSQHSSSAHHGACRGPSPDIALAATGTVTGTATGTAEREATDDFAWDRSSVAAVAEEIDDGSWLATDSTPGLPIHQGRQIKNWTGTGDPSDEPLTEPFHGQVAKSGRPDGCFGLAPAAREEDDIDSTANNADAESSSKSTKLRDASPSPARSESEVEFGATMAPLTEPTTQPTTEPTTGYAGIGAAAGTENPVSAATSDMPPSLPPSEPPIPALSPRRSRSSLRPENLPAGFSPLASTFRTTEWARHLDKAEVPEADALPAADEEDEEIPARLDVAGLLGTAAGSASSPALAMAAREMPRAAGNFNFSRKTSGNGSNSNSGVPPPSAARPLPRTRLPMPGSASASASASASTLALASASSQPGGLQSLIAQREMVIRNRARAASEARRRAEPLIDQAERKSSPKGHWPGPGAAADADNIPLSERRRLMQHRSGSNSTPGPASASASAVRQSPDRDAAGGGQFYTSTSQRGQREI